MDEVDNDAPTRTVLPYARTTRQPSAGSARLLWLLVGSSYVMAAGAALITSSSNVSASLWGAIDGALIRTGGIVALGAGAYALWLMVRHRAPPATMFAFVLAIVLATVLLTTQL